MTEERTVAAFGEAVAAGTPAPGGGAVGAVVAALAAALAAMVGRLALARTPQGDQGFDQLTESADRLRARLMELAVEDEAAFGQVIEARRSGDPATLAQAWREAAHVPAQVVRHCAEVAQLARRAAREGPPAAIGDAVMAALLAAAAGAGSLVNLRLNVQAAGRPDRLRELAENSEVILREAQRAAADARLAAEERLGGRGEAWGKKSEK
jgi:formiminotetrahydrofolate cyclodeaminase